MTEVGRLIYLTGKRGLAEEYKGAREDGVGYILSESAGLMAGGAPVCGSPHGRCT